MRSYFPLRVSLLLPVLAALWIWAPVAAEPETSLTNSTVIGTDPMLAEGAAAMLRGDWQRGIELTQAGLGSTVSVSDRAAALANLCAAHASLKQFEKALVFCNESIALQDGKWQTWQNRAACHLGVGNIEEALRDLERGLTLNPDADSLQKTLTILRDREKLQQERLRNLVES
jgi:tetratricopeptide (TPR) repeat protein